MNNNNVKGDQPLQAVAFSGS